MFYELVSRNFDCSLEFVFFSAVTSAFQLFTRKLYLQFSGLRMRNFTWNRFPVKNLLIDSLLTPIVESTYFNRDDSSKVYRNTSAFKCPWGLCHIYLKWRHTTAKGCTYMMSLRMRHPDVGFVLSCRDWRRWPLHLNTKQQEVVQC